MYFDLFNRQTVPLAPLRRNCQSIPINEALQNPTYKTSTKRAFCVFSLDCLILDFCVFHPLPTAASLHILLTTILTKHVYFDIHAALVLKQTWFCSSNHTNNHRPDSTRPKQGCFYLICHNSKHSTETRNEQ